MRPISVAAAAFLALPLAGEAVAQDQLTLQSQVVDRVAAVVGNEAILMSHIDEYIFQRTSEGLQLPDDEAGLHQLRVDALNDLVDSELLVQQARADTTIIVTDDEVARTVQSTIQNIRRNFASELEFTRELQNAGFASIEDFRRFRTEQQRRALLQTRLLDKLRAEGTLQEVEPTEAEMRNYFDERKDQAGNRPATVSFRQIVVQPEPTAAAKAVALAKADSIVAELREGADFETAARRFSEDPGSKESGGDLGWFRRGVMHTAFEQAAFTLRPGVVSEPVETPFGYHIIRVERTQPAEVQARHILIRPEVGPEQARAAEDLANDIRRRITEGASFDSLQAIYHSSAEFGETPGEVPVDQLQPPYSDVLADVQSGELLPVFRLEQPGEDDDNRARYVVLEVLQRRAEGAVRYEDVRENIRELLKQELAVQRYLAELKSATYVDVRLN